MVETRAADASPPVDSSVPDSAVTPIADAGSQEASPPAFDASTLDPKVFGKCVNESYMFWVESDGAFGPSAPLGPQSIDGTTGPWVGFVNETSVSVSVAGSVWGLRATSDAMLPTLLTPGTYTVSPKSLTPSLKLTVGGRECLQSYVGTFTIVELASTAESVFVVSNPLQRLLIGFDTKCGAATVRGCMSYGR